MGKKGRKKGDDDDWEDEAAELNAEMLLKEGGATEEDGAAAAEPEEEAGGKQKKLSNKEKKKLEKQKQFEAALAEVEGESAKAGEDAEEEEEEEDFGNKRGKKKAGKAAAEEEEEEDFGRKKGVKGKGKGKKGKGDDDDEPEVDVDEDFGKKKGAKGKGKGKKGRGDDDDDEPPPPPKAAEEEEEEDFDFGSKRGNKAKGKKDKKGKKGKGDDDDEPPPPPPPPPPAAGPVDDEEDEFDFGSKRGNKNKAKQKGKAGKGDDDDDDEPSPPEPKPTAAATKKLPAEKPPQDVPVVALLEGVRAHPEAKMLMVCTLNAGTARPSVQVVCGGTNLREGMRTVLAPLGSSVSTPQGPMAIKPVKLRGVESHGMVCGKGELGLLPPGTPFPTEVVDLSAQLELGAAFEAAMLEAKAAAAPAASGNWLSALLESCSLGDKLALAEEWCSEQGIESRAELLEAEMEEEFAQALVLKPAKEKILLKRLAAPEEPAAAPAAKPAAAAPAPKKVSFSAAALGMEDDDDMDDDDGEVAAQKLASPAAQEVFDWMVELEIPQGAASAYANQLCAKLNADLAALQAAELSMATLEELNVKKGHAMLLLHELRLAKAPPVPERLAALSSWLEGLGLREAHASRYAAVLSKEGLESREAIERALETGALSASKLAALGVLRGHVLLLLHDFRHLALPKEAPAAEEEEGEPPEFDFGATRTRLAGPSSLAFPADDELPLFSFIEMIEAAKPPLAPTPAWEEPAAEEAECDFGAAAEKPKKKKKAKEAAAEAVEEEAEFDFGAKPKKKKKDKESAAETAAEAAEEEADFDFGAKPKKKKQPKEAAAEPEEEAEFSFSPAAGAAATPPKEKKKKKKALADEDEDLDFDFGPPKEAAATPPKEKKEKKEKKKEKKAAPTAEELEAQRAKEAAEMEALLAELDEPEAEGGGIAFSLGMMQQGEGEEGAAAEGAGEGAGDGAEEEGVSPAKKGKKDKKKKKKGGGEGAAEEEDDEMALLDAAMAEAAALRGDDGEASGGKKGKKDKKKKKKGGEGAAEEEDDEMALLDAALAENAAAKAEGQDAAPEGEGEDGEDGEDGEGGEGGEGDGKLTKAQKKKLKEKAKKAAAREAGEDIPKKKEEKKKPVSKIAQRLKEEQERRALEEAALTLAAELSEEAQRLFKSLDVLALGEKALRRLDSAEVNKEVLELGARAEQAVLDFPQFDKVATVAAAVQELQAAMENFLVAEEKRRVRREKEKERKERLREEGKLLSAAERAKRAKQEAYLQSLKESGGAVPGEEGEGEGQEKKKKVVYGKKKKKPTSTEAEAAAAAEAAEAQSAAPEAEAAATAAAEESEEDWDDLDIDAKVEASGLAADDDDSEEEEFVAKPSSGLSSRLAALAESAKKDEEEAKRKKEDTLSKLINFKAEDEDEGEAGDSDDSDSDSDSDSDDELEAAKAAARAERERRAKVAEDARTPDRLRSPICCIMGHVDTGKTKLLDNIRRTNVQDGEAGGITQQIGASFFPNETLVDRMGPLVERKKINVKVPGLMIIDTPGHESFSNLRSRGSSLCDIAILVIDIMHGLEPQTIESLHMLRGKKTPFVIALNKVDRLYGWKHVKDRPVVDALEEQHESVQREFEDRASAVILALAEQGLNAALYYRNSDFREYVSLVPTSAHTGEGVPDILMLLVQLTQKLMIERIMWSSEIVCTVLEIKVVEGLGATADVMLANGTLKRGDRLVMCGFGGPVVTRVRELLTPRPLREMRVKTDYLHHDKIDGSAGIKICANHLEGVVAGSACLVPYPDVPYDLEVLKEDAMVDLNKLAKAASEVNGGVGVYAMSSTLGSLEALLEFLKTSKIPVSAVNIGPIHKRDVIKASIMHEHKSEYATILAFDVPLSKEAEQQAKELNVKVFTAEIIYHLFDKFTAYMAEVRKTQQEAARLTAVFPVICEISSPEHVWCRGGGGDPLLVGINVLQGTLKKGTPLCVERRGQKDPETGMQAYLDIGRVISMEKDRKPVEKVTAGNVASVKIDAITSVMYGRQFDHTYTLYPRITRSSINAIKDFFKEDMAKEDWTLLLQLKKQFGVI